MKFDCIAAFGCSFVKGDSIYAGKDLRHTEHITEWVGDRYRFSKILSGHYKIPELNFGRSGSSNENIFRSIYKFLNDNIEYKNPLLLIGTSGLTRKEVYSNYGNYFTELHVLDLWYHEDSMKDKLEHKAKLLTGDIANNHRLADYVRFYTKYFLNEEKEIEKLNWQLQFLISHLKLNSISYILFNSIDDNISDKIKKNSNYLSFEKNLLGKSKDCWYGHMYSEHVKKNKSWEKGSRSLFEPYGEFACGGHPSPNSHKMLANKIIKYIDENYS